MPLFFIVAGTSSCRVRLAEPVLFGVRHHPIVEEKAIARAKVVIVERIQVKVGTPMMARSTGHGTPFQNAQRAQSGVGNVGVTSRPLVVPNLAL